MEMKQLMRKTLFCTRCIFCLLVVFCTYLNYSYNIKIDYNYITPIIIMYIIMFYFIFVTSTSIEKGLSFILTLCQYILWAMLAIAFFLTIYLAIKARFLTFDTTLFVFKDIIVFKRIHNLEILILGANSYCYEQGYNFTPEEILDICKTTDTMEDVRYRLDGIVEYYMAIGNYNKQITLYDRLITPFTKVTGTELVVFFTVNTLVAMLCVYFFHN